MVDIVEGLLEINECAERLLFFALPDPEQIIQGEDMIYKGPVWPESILLVHYDIIFSRNPMILPSKIPEYILPVVGRRLIPRSSEALLGL